MLDEHLRRELARAAIRAGRLPSRSPERMGSRSGTQLACAVCSGPVQPSEEEIKLGYDHGAVQEAEVFHLHIRCFAAWEFERTKIGR